MGTSKSLPTPSGGDWSPLKGEITGAISGARPTNAVKIIGKTIQAAGGLGSTATDGESRSSGGGVGGGGLRGRAATSRAVSGLASFGSSVASQGLSLALSALGLRELRDRPALEVITRVAGHLSSHAEGLDRAILSKALTDTLLDVANLEGNVGYADLEKSLESFLQTDGIDGLIEVFLTNILYDQVFVLVEDWVSAKSRTNGSMDALASAIATTCRDQVREYLAEVKAEGSLDRIDWFGRQGLDAGERLVREFEQRLVRAAAEVE